MFGIGGTELLVILLVALVVLGPKSLPKIARTLGKAMGEFRRVSTEFQRTMNLEAAEDEAKAAAAPAATGEAPKTDDQEKARAEAKAAAPSQAADAPRQARTAEGPQAAAAPGQEKAPAKADLPEKTAAEA